ncbi:hypothetical protein AB1Y20_010316 [Prymnesium parvum]|uniref:Guanine nucleotide-binding protein subunit beta-like protein n=1 Tax=Prymnesium parvum TaxID=97485 RepID=A0AB34K4G2_PRYPA
MLGQTLAAACVPRVYPLCVFPPPEGEHGRAAATLPDMLRTVKQLRTDARSIKGQSSAGELERSSSTLPPAGSAGAFSSCWLRCGAATCSQTYARGGVDAVLALQRARRPSLFSAEGAQRRQYGQPLTLSLKAAPTHVECFPVSPHDVAVACSLRSTSSTRSTLFALGSRAVMRTFHGHSRAVHAARFSPHGPQLYTASDDATAKCWDVVAEAQVRCFEGHTDFVRSAAAGGGAAQLLLTGSYDHTVVLWDVHAAGGGVMTLRHAAPVEAVVALPGGGLVATASGATLTLWDILSGGRVLHSVSAHSKTTTSLCADADGAHLLSASLDRMVKVYDLSTCAVVASLKYAAPLLALALSPSGSDLVVGQSKSTLCVRTRMSAAPPPPPSDEPYGPRGGRLPGQRPTLIGLKAYLF